MAEEDGGNKFRQYYINPLLWVEDFFGDNIALTSQQKEGMIEIGKLVNAKLKKNRGEKLNKEEEAYSKKIGISIMSGKGTGKDFWAALVSLFFMMFENMKGLGTANSAKQLRNVFWSEIAKVMSLSKRLDESNPQSPTILEEMIEWQQEKIYMKHLKGRRWFMEAVTVPDRASEEDQAKALTGRHEDHMCFVIDEAAGMPDAVFSKLEGTLTGKLNLIIMIFNPIRRTGFAVRSQFEESDKWVTLRWNSEESEIVNKSHIENLAKYGKDSNVYRVDVLGLPPKAEADTLIPYEWVMDAIGRDLSMEGEPTLKGVDVGAGGDKSVILTRIGGTVITINGFNEADTMAFAGRVAQEALRDDPEGTFIDVIGVGKGVYDRLLEQGHKVYAVDVRRTARSERYKNRRDELWQKLRGMFENGTISIPDNEDLKRELISIKTEPPDSHGRQVVESKQKMKRRIGHSPDTADALCISMAFDDAVFKPQNTADAYDRYGENDYNYQTSGSWMSNT